MMMAYDNSSAMEGESQFTYGERVGFAVVILIIIVVGTIGNSIVILAVLLSKGLQNITNVFVVSLATADLCYCLLLPLSTVVGLVSVDGWPWASEVPCWLAALMSVTSAGASLYNLACIALNRMLLIRGPAAAFKWLFTPKKTAFLVLSTWAIPMTTMLIPPAFGIGALGYDRSDNTCSDIDAHPRFRDYHLVQLLCLYPVPLATIVVSYSMLFVHIKHHFEQRRKSFRESHKMAGNGEPEDTARQLEDRFDKRMHKQQLQITVNLFIVSCVFLLCSAPFSLALLAPRNVRALLFLSIPFMANSSVNPILYTVHHPKFTVVIGCMLRCRFGDIPKPSKLLLAVHARCARSHTTTI